jgi:ATP-dependent RNA helicase DDX18/HAS1
MYYTTLLRRLKFNVRALHEGMKREAIKETLQEFSRTTGLSQDDDVDDEEYSSTLILCMLDFQGKDNHIPIPSTTNWIVQFEPCTNPSEYIYQVGRISHDTVATRSGNRRASYNSSLSSNTGRGTLPPSSPPPRALLFLTPNEYGFHKYYKAAQVKTYEYEIPHLCNVQSRLIKLLRCDENKELRKLGLRACRAYLFAYARHEFGDIYDVNELNVEKVALSFGFDSLPSEELLESIRNGGDNDAALGFLFDEKVRTTSTNTNSNCNSSLRRKTAKASSSTWMTGEKTWKHADRHADTIRVNNPTIGAIKPKLVVTR